MTNETIKHQLNHRTIRAFKPTNLSAEQLNTLYSLLCCQSYANQYVYAADVNYAHY